MAKPVEDSTTPIEFEPAPMRGPAMLAPEVSLGVRLKAARDHYALTIDALARLTKSWDGYIDGQTGVSEQSGVSASALRRYEASEALPTAREIRILCDALGFGADWLIFGRTSAQHFSPEEEKFLLAQRALHGHYAARAAQAGALEIDSKGDDARQRADLIEQAKRR